MKFLLAMMLEVKNPEERKKISINSRHLVIFVIPVIFLLFIFASSVLI